MELAASSLELAAASVELAAGAGSWLELAAARLELAAASLELAAASVELTAASPELASLELPGSKKLPGNWRPSLACRGPPKACAERACHSPVLRRAQLSQPHFVTSSAVTPPVL